MNTLTDISKGLKPLLLSKGKTFFKNAPVASNVVFSVVLLVAEKIVDMDFTCPCGAECRFHLLVLLFVIPGLVVSVLVTAVQRSAFFQCDCSIMKNVKKFCVCIFPPAVWVMLLFLDGRYYACIKTDWLGRYVAVSGSVLEKWCQPDNRTSYQEQLKKSEEWFACSQTYGFYLFGTLAILALIIIKVENQPSNSGGTSSTPEGNDPENLAL